MDFTVQLAKCMVENDARMARYTSDPWTGVHLDAQTNFLTRMYMCFCFRFKVAGELPLMHVRISNQKIQNVLDLVSSIPLPNMGSTPSTPTKKIHLVRSNTLKSY